MLKICRTILRGKSLWRALPVAVLSVFSFAFCSETKAAINYQVVGPTAGGGLTIPTTTENNYLFCFGNIIGTYGYQFILNSSTSTPLTTSYAGYSAGQWAYLEDVSAGTYTFTDNSWDTNWKTYEQWKCVLLEDVLSFTTIQATSTNAYSEGFTSSLADFEADDVIFMGGKNDSFNVGYNSLFQFQQSFPYEGSNYFSSWQGGAMAAWGFASTTANYFTQAYHPTDIITYDVLRFEAAPDATGSVYWAGVGTQALYKGEINRIPFYYNICSDWETFKSYDDELWVEIKQGETQIASSYYVNFRVPLYDNSECKGFRYISMDSGLVNIAATGTMDIILRNDPATSTEKIYGQNTFFYNYDWRDGLTYFNRLFNSPLIIPQKTGTSTITFEYGFNELNVDRVCWFNEDWQVLNTDVCTSTDQIDNEGIGGLDLPNQITKTIYKGSFAAVDTSNNILLKTEPFQIVWANDWKDAFSEIASSTDDSLLKLTGLSAHDLACTQEEWAESTESWFNWQKLKCNSLYSMFFAGEVITNAIKIFVKTTSDIILTIFPLNIPKNIIQQWNLSEGKNLPAGLEMLTPQDENGNIYITLSPELAGATSTIQIWGEEIYYATPGLETFFNFIKEFTKILLWLLVLVEIIGIGFQILKDINHEEEPDFELSSIHYDSKGQYSASYRPKK